MVNVNGVRGSFDIYLLPQEVSGMSRCGVCALAFLSRGLDISYLASAQWFLQVVKPAHLTLHSMSIRNSIQISDLLRENGLSYRAELPPRCCAMTAP